jgi:hypothetical protein
MTLKDKFNNLVPIEFGGMQEPLLSDCEKIAEEFAIIFSEWCANRYVKLHSVWCPIFGDQRDKNNWKTSNELLEIFKKEKGL